MWGPMASVMDGVRPVAPSGHVPPPLRGALHVQPVLPPVRWPLLVRSVGGFGRSGADRRPAGHRLRPRDPGGRPGPRGPAHGARRVDRAHDDARDAVVDGAAVGRARALRRHLHRRRRTHDGGRRGRHRARLGHGRPLPLPHRGQALHRAHQRHVDLHRHPDRPSPRADGRPLRVRLQQRHRLGPQRVGRAGLEPRRRPLRRGAEHAAAHLRRLDQQRGLRLRPRRGGARPQHRRPRRLVGAGVHRDVGLRGRRPQHEPLPRRGLADPLGSAPRLRRRDLGRLAVDLARPGHRGREQRRRPLPVLQWRPLRARRQLLGEPERGAERWTPPDLLPLRRPDRLVGDGPRPDRSAGPRRRWLGLGVDQRRCRRGEPGGGQHGHGGLGHLRRGRHALEQQHDQPVRHAARDAAVEQRARVRDRRGRRLPHGAPRRAVRRLHRRLADRPRPGAGGVRRGEQRRRRGPGLARPRRGQRRLRRRQHRRQRLRRRRLGRASGRFGVLRRRGRGLRRVRG